MSTDLEPAMIFNRSGRARGGLGIVDSRLQIDVPTWVRPLRTPKRRVHAERVVHVVHTPMIGPTIGRTVEANLLLKDEFGEVFGSPIGWDLDKTLFRLGEAGYEVELHRIPRVIAPFRGYVTSYLWLWARSAGWTRSA